MNRRRFLALLGMAPVVAKLAPVVEALTPAPVEFDYFLNPKYIVPPLADSVFKATPITVFLKARQVGRSALVNEQMLRIFRGDAKIKWTVTD